MTSQTRTTESRRTNRGVAAAVAEAWADCRYASRRWVQRQTGPVAPHTSGR